VLLSFFAFVVLLLLLLLLLLLWALLFFSSVFGLFETLLLLPSLLHHSFTTSSLLLRPSFSSHITPALPLFLPLSLILFLVLLYSPSHTLPTYILLTSSIVAYFYFYWASLPHAVAAVVLVFSSRVMVPSVGLS
jgi:hypothetical protein